MAKIGMSPNMDNTFAFVPPGLDLTSHPRLQKLCENNHDGNGLVMCRQPLDGSTALADPPPGEILVGNEPFTSRRLPYVFSKTNSNLCK